ncbi:MAG: glycosyltransferase family 4 protein [Cytophagales bacterium]|nr:glycosyltransferase family 4 protein [Rhizobacter sp.]
MRILIISNCPLDPNQGSGYVITGYAQHMRERGHQVTAYGIEHFTPFPQMRRLTRIRRLLGYAYTAVRHARASSYDIVELWGAEGWLALLCLRALGRHHPIPVSRSNGLETHWHQLLRQPDTSWRARVRRYIQELPEIAFRGCAALTLVSHYDARYARERGYQPEQRLLVMENALEPSWLHQSPLFEREPVIGFVGAWLANKGSELLIPVIERVLASTPSARFVLIGVGTQGQAALAQAFPGEARVIAIASCPRAELRAHYHRMALLLMPSVFESFGLVAAEAMSCGVALVSTRVGFAADLSPAECTHLDERTPASIARTLTALLSDERRRQDQARAGHARVQALEWAPVADQLETLYQTLLAPPAEAASEAMARIPHASR